jgi:hypothetical protein
MAKPQTPEKPKSSSERIKGAVEALKDAVNHQKNQIDNRLSELKTVLTNISVEERKTLKEEIDSADALVRENPAIPNSDEKLGVLAVIADIRKELEDLRANVGEYYVPVAAAGAAAQSGFSKLWGKTTAGFGGMFAKVKEFFGMGGDKKSSVGSGFGLKAVLVGMGFIPFLDSIPGMKEKKEELKLRIAHIASTKKVEAIVSAENKTRKAGSKIAVDLTDFEIFQAAIDLKQLSQIGSKVLSALRTGTYNSRNPLRWTDIAKAPPLVAVAQAKPPVQEKAETPSSTP